MITLVRCVPICCPAPTSLALAITQDLFHFTNIKTFLEACVFSAAALRLINKQPRPNYFDSYLVESGPMPLPLSDGLPSLATCLLIASSGSGNLLFIYNSARQLQSGLEYNVGFLILNGTVWHIHAFTLAIEPCSQRK